MVEKSDKLVANLEENMGFVLDFEKTLAELDPEFLAAFAEMKRVLLDRDRALSRKTKALIHVALSAARRAPGLKTHTARAMRLGATRDEIIEAIEVSFFTFGGPAARYGTETLMELLKEASDTKI
jgi:AhpD family alkylhydroperoxidase